MFDLSKHNFVPQEASSRCAVCGRPFAEHELSPPATPDSKFEQFQAHLKETAEEVRSWPAWKREGAKATMGFTTSPVEDPL